MNQEILSSLEIDAIGEIINISLGASATAISTMLSSRVEITVPRVRVESYENFEFTNLEPAIAVTIDYIEGILGSNIMILKKEDVRVILETLMQTQYDPENFELDEIGLSAVCEVMNQMMGATATSLSSIFKSRVDLAPPKVRLIDLAGSDNITDSVTGGEPLAQFAFRMVVEDLIDSEIMLLLPLNVARDMVDGLLHSHSAAPAPAPAPQPARAAVQSPAPMAAAAPMMQQQPQTFASPPPQQQRGPSPMMNDQNVMVHPAQFAPLKQSGMNVSDSNIGMIMDVPLQVTVELGRTRKLIREILELAPGSVLELDKLAGEPVDILVNGKIVAKGEVVVIDENFGVRITGIVSMQERASTLQ